MCRGRCQGSPAASASFSDYPRPAGRLREVRRVRDVAVTCPWGIPHPSAAWPGPVGQDAGGGWEGWDRGLPCRSSPAAGACLSVCPSVHPHPRPPRSRRPRAVPPLHRGAGRAAPSWGRWGWVMGGSWGGGTGQGGGPAELDPSRVFPPGLAACRVRRGVPWPKNQPSFVGSSIVALEFSD